MKYSLHEPRRGRADIKAFITDFRVAFPDLNFWGTADLIAEGDYVVGQWEGGGTHIPLLDYILVGVWAQAQCLCRVDFPDLPFTATTCGDKCGPRTRSCRAGWRAIIRLLQRGGGRLLLT